MPLRRPRRVFPFALRGWRDRESRWSPRWCRWSEAQQALRAPPRRACPDRPQDRIGAARLAAARPDRRPRDRAKMSPGPTLPRAVGGGGQVRGRKSSGLRSLGNYLTLHRRNVIIANDNRAAERYPGAMSISANFAASPRVKRAADLARTVLRTTLDLALPPLCASCREPVEGRGLCPACWSKLSFITRPYCERLGIPFAYDPGPGILSMEAIADPPAYNRARAAVRFDEISRALVHSLKYGDRLDLAPMMGHWMSHAGREILAEADALAPVPLHWRRQWARRFNQSAMLAATVSAASRVPIAAGVLKRVKGHCPAGWADAIGAGQQCAGRIQGARREQSRSIRPPVCSGRRCINLGRDRRGLRAGAESRWRRQRRCADLRPGCRSGANRHIGKNKKFDQIYSRHGCGRDLYYPVLPLLPGGKGPALPQGSGLP